VEVKREQVVDAASRSASQQEPTLEDVEETDIIEREWQNGIKQWTSVGQLREDLKQEGASRGLEANELRVPTAPPVRATSRGLVDWGLKALKILRVSPAEETAKLSIRQIIKHFEDKLRPDAGLYRIQGQMVLEDRKLTARNLSGKSPYLLFIHGTASTTTGSFGRLANTAEMKALQDIYGGRMLAFQHRTLSQSPIENALELARALPKNAELHIVSHSRGGLVGELLCMTALSDKDEESFRHARRDEDVKALRELSGELASKNFRVGKFVRVACPARGTILASKRLDLYFSVILNLLGLIPALKGNPIYSFVKATLLELAKRRARPEEVPGLEAQMPESPLIHLLNRPGIVTKADLAVIAGDMEGSGFWGNLKAFATDLFYWEDHDLVVNTSAMYGGMSRDQGAYYFFDKGPEVNHFNYFENRSTRQRMLGWLTRADGQKKDDGFQLIRRGALDMEESRTRGAAKDLPSVFVLPGVMGSHLRDKDGRIWLNFESLATGGIERLAISNGQVKPDGMVAAGYQRLVSFLGASYKVIPFPYDWRLSVNTSSAQLAAALEAELESHERPVHMIAHSMGGLVARAMMAQNPELWESVTRRGGRLLMLGTPNQGSFAILRMLLGKERLPRQLSLLDPKLRLSGIVDLLRQLPGLLEMLPEGKAGNDFFDPAWWHGVSNGTHAPADRALEEARQVRESLSKIRLPSNLIYVAGSAPATPVAIRISPGGDISFEMTADGDGRTVYHSQLLNNAPTWYMSAQHGEMADHQPSFQALLELLDTGKTTRLSRSPARPRAQAEAAELTAADEAPLLFPTQEELVGAALGSEPQRASSEERHIMRISVAHGDLARAQYPVAVGHYLGDTLVSAEARLDKYLEGRLSELFRMDLYPGQQGSVEVVYAPESSPKGALVIGLGEVGGITPEIVRRGITNAALRYALMVAHAPRAQSASGYSAASVIEAAEGNGQPENFEQPWRSAAFSALLIGTFGGNALSVEASLNAIVQGAMQANQALYAQGLWDQVRIDELEIVDLYEDVALEAMRAAARIEERPPLDMAKNLEIELNPPYLRALGGGRVQRPANQYDTGWWRRIKIEGVRNKETGEPTGDLHYLALTDRARAEDTLQVTQGNLIESYLEMATSSTDYSHKLGATLFELLVPNALKNQINLEANLVLVLDSIASDYPWELLAQPTREEPLALHIGLIRQFVTKNYEALPQPIRERAALVIGAAKVEKMSEGQYPDLPGARKEAEVVAASLSAAGYDTGQAIMDAAPQTVISEFVTRRYKILHLAGHGRYEPGDEKRSGMVLGNDVFLSTAEIKSLGPIPELAFINCCHLGRMDDGEVRVTTGSPHILAASIAQALINKGVKAVVAAGWAVEDAPAFAFAKEFYSRMFDGQTFGQAVIQARKAAREAAPSSNTWGAYQCYGNPGFVLEQKAETRGEASKKRMFSRREYLDALSNIEEAAATATAEERDELAGRLMELYDSLPPHWRDGGTLNGFGDAWAALGSFDKAIEIYDKAIRQEKAKAPISAIEQLANLLSRYALILREQEHEPEAAARTDAGMQNVPDLINRAEYLLELILKLSKTSEQLSISGGHYKHLAAASDGEERKGMLKKAIDAYAQARKEDAKNKRPDFYPTLNWIACRFLLGSPLKKKETLEMVARAKKAAERAEESMPSLWNRVAGADAELLSHLIKKDLPAHKEKVKEMYRKVFLTGAKPKDISSVKGQITIFIRILNSASEKKDIAETVHALREINEVIGV
jgi:tetratricopeptide (TPR) repeat protein/pimeloyl-ACP methyl ester carboxylesterase